MTPTGWRFGYSPTLKSIYVLRYGLFSGGAAIAGALIERAISGGMHVVVGLLAGLGVGLVAFRSQLLPFQVPTLALTQRGLLFVRKSRVIEIPWDAIRGLHQDTRTVTLELSRALPGPRGEPAADAVPLRALEYGMTSTALHHLLHAHLGPSSRADLPTDARAREELGVRAGG